MKTGFKILGRKSRPSKVVARPRRSLKARIAMFLLGLIALVSFGLLVMPYIPRVIFWITRPSIDPTSYQQAAADTKKGKKPTISSDKPGNRLILPGIGADVEIVEGSNLNVIGKNQGAWRETRSTDPTTDGNIVLAGHRWIGYDITNIGQFYNLPELKNGNKIYVRWNDKMYEYEIYNTRTVLPTQVDIRDEDSNVPKKLTMYTCYPLGSTAKRFVVEAKQL